MYIGRDLPVFHLLRFYSASYSKTYPLGGRKGASASVYMEIEDADNTTDVVDQWKAVEFYRSSGVVWM